ncbi:hypothetical protein [Streptomyces sp. NPDC006285]|uniref:hypothetical protein n=1 Tax=Streptomyces sp. NPDC006285 TaxID=3364742 RepID=UPI0036B23C0A
MLTDDPKCVRNGCRLPVELGDTPVGRRRLRKHCGHACVVWEARARRALESGDADEARELLRLAQKLDARTHPGQDVPGVFTDTREAA